MLIEVPSSQFGRKCAVISDFLFFQLSAHLLDEFPLLAVGLHACPVQSLARIFESLASRLNQLPGSGDALVGALIQAAEICLIPLNGLLEALH